MFGFQGLGFRVQGFRVFRVQGLGFRVQGFREETSCKAETAAHV